MSPQKQGLRRLAEKAGQRGAGQLPKIVNWRTYVKKGNRAITLSRAFAEQLAIATGFRAEWLLFGTLPKRQEEDAPASSRGEVLDLLERMHGPVPPGVLAEYLRYRLRMRMMSSNAFVSPDTFADELLGKKNLSFRRKMLAVWLRQPIPLESVPQYLEVLRRSDVSPVTINTWWEKQGQYVGPLLTALAKEQTARARGIAEARSRGADDDAVLAVIESGALSDTAPEAVWRDVVISRHLAITRGVKEALVSDRGKRKRQPPAAPKSSRAPKSTRKTVNDR